MENIILMLKTVLFVLLILHLKLSYCDFLNYNNLVN